MRKTHPFIKVINKGRVLLHPSLKHTFLRNLLFAVICLTVAVPANAAALLGFDVDVTSSASTGYDDNITQDNDNELSDSVTKLSAGIGAKQEGETYDLDIDGTFTQHLYASHSSLNNNAQNVNIALRKEISKYDRFSASNRFVHAEDTGGFDDDFGRTSGRYSYWRNRFHTDYERDLSKHVLVKGYYGNEFYAASRDNSNDSTMHHIGADGFYILNSSTAYILGYDFTTRHIDNNGSAQVHTIATGARHFLTKQLYIDGRVGVSFVDGYSGSSTSEPNVVVALSNDFSETDSASISYRKTSMPTTDTAAIWDSWRVALSFARQISKRLDGGVSIFYGEGEYDAFSIDDQQTGVSARLNYDIKEDVTAFLAYTYSEVDSNLDSRNYARNRVEAGVRMTF